MEKIPVSKISKMLEDLLKLPIYEVVGAYNENLLYVSNDEGKLSLWKYDLRNKNKRKLTIEAIYQVSRIREYSKFVYFTRDVSKGKELQLVYSLDLENEKEEVFSEMDPIRIVGLADGGNYVAFTGVTEKGISIYKAHNRKVERLVDLPGLSFVFDANENLITGYGIMKGNPKSMEIFIYDLSRNELEIYSPKEGSTNTSPIISRNKIYFETDAFDKNRKMIVELDVDNKELKFLDFMYKDYSEFKPIEHIYFEYVENSWVVIAKKEGRAKLFIDGRLVPTKEGFVNSAIKLGNKVYFSYSSLIEPYSIIEYDLNTNQSNVLIENPLPKEYSDLIGSKSFDYIESYDGLKIPTYFIESKQAGKPGPTAIYVHGGPWFEVMDYWSVFMISLALLGFNVIAPNFRGSTGYGEEFRKLDIGDPGGGDLKDIEACAKYALTKNIANKLFIIGYSYGGYMTLWALANCPDLFEAGVAGASVTDWEEMLKLSDAMFKNFIITLFDNKLELLKERSPINKAKNIKAPLCIIHPQNDSRTPLKPVLRLMQELSENGKSFEAHIAPDMGHVISDIEDAEKILLPALLFLNRKR